MASESSTAGQPNVRIIPIQVEGRDYVGKHEANQSEQTLHNEPPNQQEHPTQRVNSGSSMGFGAEIPRHPFQAHDRPAFGRMHFDDGFGDDDIDGFNRNSIFDRVKDFPVKDFFPSRMASPGRGQNSMFTQAGAGQSHSPPRQQQQQQQQQQQPNKSQQQPQQQQPPEPNQQQQEQQQQHHQPPPSQRPDERQKSPSPQPPPPTKMKDDSIEKIKKIQADVLALMDQVEHFEASGRKDKRYLYLDEMLTQNLLKLDTVDTEGKDNIKLARREAIKCINHCISVLEAKVEASEEAANNQPGDSDANPTETHDSQVVDKKSASADNVLRNAEQSAEIKKSSSQK